MKGSLAKSELTRSVIEAFRHAVDVGYNYFDTAPGYGEGRSAEEVDVYGGAEWAAVRAVWNCRKVLRAGVTITLPTRNKNQGNIEAAVAASEDLGVAGEKERRRSGFVRGRRIERRRKPRGRLQVQPFPVLVEARGAEFQRLAYFRFDTRGRHLDARGTRRGRRLRLLRRRPGRNGKCAQERKDGSHDWPSFYLRSPLRSKPQRKEGLDGGW